MHRVYKSKHIWSFLDVTIIPSNFASEIVQVSPSQQNQLGGGGGPKKWSEKSSQNHFPAGPKIQGLPFICSVFHDDCTLDLPHQSSYDVIRENCCFSICLDAWASASFSPYLLSSYQSIINSKDKTNYHPVKVKLLADSKCFQHLSIFRKQSYNSAEKENHISKSSRVKMRII